VYCSARKSDYVFVLGLFVHDVQQMGFTVTGLVLRTDCAAELADAAALGCYKQHGIRHFKTSPTLHHQNFMVEYVTGKISEISRVILHTSGMDQGRRLAVRGRPGAV